MANETRYVASTVNTPVDLFAIDNSYAESIVYDDQDRTSGNIFIWKNATGNDNDGTIYKAGDGTTQNGEWHMQYDASYLNVKWFGAKGDWTAGGGTDDTAAIQSALNITKNAATNVNIYLPKGRYKITAAAGTDALILDLTATTGGGGRRVNIYGAGAEESSLVYDGPYNNVNVLKIISVTNVVMALENFEITGISESVQLGTGLYLEKTYPLSIKNMMFRGLNEGVRLNKVNNAIFNTVYCRKVNYGFVGQSTGAGTLPNMLDFISCQFIENLITGVKLTDAHSVSFLSCDVSYSGASNTPALTEVACIDCTFIGRDGASGLNISNCYFEANMGLADIRVKVNTNIPLQPGNIPNPYYGTHNFKGNTFNRNTDVVDPNGDPSHVPPIPPNFDPSYTKHNILIVGSGQDRNDPAYLFGRSKCKLVFEGNGFFVNVPGAANNYVPDPSRRAIQIDYFTDPISGVVNYWEFDIVEEGNAYAGAAFVSGGDAPVFTPPVFTPPSPATILANPRLTPQVSEFTRVKAFGTVTFRTEDNPVFIVKDSYNIVT